MEHAACSAGIGTITANPTGSFPPTGTSLEKHDGSDGFWLRSPTIEVFVALSPVFRLLALRQPGFESLTADGTVAQQGLRLACMEPEQTPSSFEVGNQSAVILERTSCSARVRLSPYRDLRYTVTLTLESRRPQIRLTYTLENMSDVPRRVACWSVLSFARRGSIVVPQSGERNGEEYLALPEWTSWPQPGVRFGKRALSASLESPLHGPAYKVGVVAPPGWIAFHRGAEALVSVSPFEPSADYPEQGANVTFFEADDGMGVTWCEIEHVSPLQSVVRGCAARLSQAVQLVQGVAPASLEPDAFRSAIESRMLPVG